MSSSPILAQDTTPDGKELVLHRRDGIYTLRVDGLELMSSRGHGSEEALARLACEGLSAKRQPRVLVGGLGFGYTLRSALDHLPEDATVVVSEIFGSLLDWHRGLQSRPNRPSRPSRPNSLSSLADLAGRPLEDRRVEATQADVWEFLHETSAFDAIILDVDNGPQAFTVESNFRLYQRDGLERLAASLVPGGTLAIWSADEAPGFECRFQGSGFKVSTRRVPARGGSGLQHTIFLGVRG